MNPYVFVLLCPGFNCRRGYQAHVDLLLCSMYYEIEWANIVVRRDLNVPVYLDASFAFHMEIHYYFVVVESMLGNPFFICWLMYW